ncbi:helix-turn-helix domain-containing protein [Priestia aryabhattai]|uniref:helix-turn-helix domain-containing protein n=1 Tax=Priestia aryabhattai TaxID=412384 RepID=UPI003C8E3C12
MNTRKRIGPSKEMKLEIGRRIRERRKAQNLRTNKVFGDLNIPRTTYTGYETGSRTPDPETMNTIASYLNTTVSYLTCETDDPYTHKTNESVDLEELIEEKKLTIEGKPLTDEQWEILYKTLKTINDQNEKNTVQ